MHIPYLLYTNEEYKSHGPLITFSLFHSFFQKACSSMIRRDAIGRIIYAPCCTYAGVSDLPLLRLLEDILVRNARYRNCGLAYTRHDPERLKI